MFAWLSGSLAAPESISIFLCVCVCVFCNKLATVRVDVGLISKFDPILVVVPMCGIKMLESPVSGHSREAEKVSVI